MTVLRLRAKVGKALFPEGWKWSRLRREDCEHEVAVRGGGLRESFAKELRRLSRCRSDESAFGAEVEVRYFGNCPVESSQARFENFDCFVHHRFGDGARPLVWVAPGEGAGARRIPFRPVLAGCRPKGRTASAKCSLKSQTC